MSKKRILFLEDDDSIRDVVNEYLTIAGYETTLVTDGEAAIEALSQNAFDLALLDIMTPRKNGLEALAWISENAPQMGKIMLTALGDEKTQVAAFNDHADDYVIKPFSPILLLKRIEAVLRRVETAPLSLESTEKNLTLSAESFRAYYGGEPLPLTLSEFLLLQKLMENPKRVFNRVNLLDALYQGDYYGSDRVIDSHIKNLRKKLPKPYIKTVIGVGYQFDEEADQ